MNANRPNVPQSGPGVLANGAGGGLHSGTMASGYPASGFSFTSGPTSGIASGFEPVSAVTLASGCSPSSDYDPNDSSTFGSRPSPRFQHPGMPRSKVDVIALQNAMDSAAQKADK